MTYGEQKKEEKLYPPAETNREVFMLIKTISCVVLILLCLGISLFAEKIFYFTSRWGGPFGEEWVKRWPGWMFPVWLWMVRIVGILGAIVGIWLLLDRK
jgi:hypothetical protein